MKLAFITHPVTKTECVVSIAKAIRDHDPVSIDFTWERNGDDWVFNGWVVTGELMFVKASANLLHHVDRFLTENGMLKVCTPELLMKKLEDNKCEHVVIHGGEQLLAGDVAKVTDQYRPSDFEHDVLVNAVDADDAASTIKGRMLKILKDEEDKAEAVGKWFANGKKIEKVPGKEKPQFIAQSDYHIKHR